MSGVQFRPVDGKTLRRALSGEPSRRALWARFLADPAMWVPTVIALIALVVAATR